MIESLVRFESRPRAVAASGGLLVILRGVNANPGADPEDMVSLRVWIGSERVITVRQRRVLATQEVREALEAGSGPTSIPDLLEQLVERLADRIVSFVDDIEERILAFEGEVESGSAGAVRSELSALRRQTAVVRRFVAPLREAVEALSRLGGERFGPEWAYSIRDQADRVTRSVEDLDLIRERALVAQEDLLNRINQEQNDRLYVFSVLAAVFLPITFITGLFGMNTAGLPGLEHPAAFWLVVGAMLTLTVGTVVYLRLKSWF